MLNSSNEPVLEPFQNETFRTTHIQSMPLFGSKRLALVKLFAKLVSLNNKSINETVVKLGTLNVIMVTCFGQ